VANRPIILEHNGERRTIAEWCEHLGLPLHIVRNRIHMGMNAKDALETPLGNHKAKQQVRLYKHKKGG
jgi:hypothetical protein